MQPAGVSKSLTRSEPAVKTETALGYLKEEAKLGQLDLELLDLFIEAKVYEEGLTN